MQTKTKREIKLKSGKRFAAGSYAYAEAMTFNLLVHIDGTEFKLPYSAAHKYLDGFCKPPTMATLEKWSYNGRSKTPAGKTVEEDGHDGNGFPSWHMILGFC